MPARSTRRVLPWHGGDSEYLEGTAEGGKWSCVIDRELIRWWSCLIDPGSSLENEFSLS
jgi:hypothetical protein